MRAQACIIIVMKKISIAVLSILLLVLAVFATSLTADVAYADDVTVVEFTYDSSSGQTEYVGDNFVAKILDGKILYAGTYDETLVKNAIESEIGTEYEVVIPLPEVEISLQGDVTETEFSPYVHPFTLTASSKHPFWRIAAFSRTDSEFGYEWRYSTVDTNGVEIPFGGTASSVPFGGGRSHGEYTIRCKATVGFTFGNATFFASNVSDGVILTINRASSEPSVSALTVTKEYGDTVEEILSSKNVPSSEYYWSLEKNELGDTVPIVGNHAYSVVVIKGKYDETGFVRDDNFTPYSTTLAVSVKARKIYLKAQDMTIVEGGPVGTPVVELYESSLAPVDEIADLGVYATDTDASVGKREMRLKWNNPNYEVYFRSERMDGSSPMLTVLPSTLTYADMNFAYEIKRADGFALDDILTAVETDDGVRLSVVRNGETVEYDDLTLTLKRVSTADGVFVIGGGKTEKIAFDENGVVTLDGIGFYISAYETENAPSLDEDGVDYTSLAIALGGFFGAVAIGLVLSLILIKGKRRKDDEKREDLAIETLSLYEKEVAARSAIDETATIKAEENLSAGTEENVDEKDADISVENADDEKAAKDENQPKRKIKLANGADKTSKEAYDERNAELFESVGFIPTPTVEEAFKGYAEEDIDRDDADDKEDKEDGEKITFSSKMTNTSVRNQAIYNALKNEILSYRGMKSRVVNGGDYFRRPGKQIIKIIIIGKTVRLALALNPSDYDYNLYHQKDRGAMKKYADTPMFIKVQSPLGVKRAFILISDLMQKEGLKKDKKYEYVDAMYSLSYPEEE